MNWIAIHRRFERVAAWAMLAVCLLALGSSWRQRAMAQEMPLTPSASAAPITPAPGTAASPPPPATTTAPTAGAPAAAKKEEKEQPATQPASKDASLIDFDAEIYMNSKMPFEPVLNDGLWKFTASQGRRFASLPLRLSAGKSSYTLDPNSVSFKLAKFVTYMIEYAPESGVVFYADEQKGEALLDSPPLFAKSLTINPDGMMHWGIDKFGPPNAEVVGSNNRMFAYKLRADTLTKMFPQAPKMRPGGRREDLDANQADRQAFQAALAHHRELSQQVRGLPTKFKAKLPTRVWVVFDLLTSSTENDINFEGIGKWKATHYEINVMRGYVAQGMTEKDIDNRRLVMADLVEKKGSSINLQLVAMRLVMDRLISTMQPGDAIYRACDGIIKAGDSRARMTVVAALATTFPPTVATTTLLRVAFMHMNASERLAMFQNMVQNVNADRSQEILDQANRMLTDPNGPPVRETMLALLKSADDPPPGTPVAAGAPSPEDRAAIRKLLITGIRFDAIPDARLDEAIVCVVENATTSGLARDWLDMRLLGAVNPRIVKLTLDVLLSASTTDQTLNVLAKTARGLVFGKTAAPATPQRNRISLGAPIAVTSTSHSLFRVLQHNDVNVQAMAWECLPRFAFVIPANVATDPYTFLVDLALKGSSTPKTLVDFLVQQKDRDRVLIGLMRVVLGGSEGQSSQAIRELLRPKAEWPIDRAILQLSYGDRQGFATRVYETMDKQTPPLAVGLLRQRSDNNPVAIWFGREMSAGRVPARSGFLVAAAPDGSITAGENALLEIVPGTDAEMAAAAVSALVLAAGGEDRMVPPIVQKFRGLQDQSLPALKLKWTDERKTIYALRLQRAAGPYTMTLRVAPATAGATPTDISLGVVNVQVENQTVKLANETLKLSIPDNLLAIRIDKVAEFKNFTNDQLVKFPIDKVEQPCDLMPQSDNSWRGKFRLPAPDGRQVDVALVPAR